MLHKKLHIHRGDDVIYAWCYPQAKRVAYVYTDVKRQMETAFTTSEVAKMVHRHPKIVKKAFKDGNIPEPQQVYGLEGRNIFTYMWREQDIMGLHDFLKTVHIGRPRKDGMITTGKLPTARELRAMIKHDTVLYVQNDDGEFVPTWQAEKF